MVAVGVGGGDAIDVMTGQPFNLRWPKLIGVHLTGSLSGWASPKDVILKVAGVLTVRGRHRRHRRVLRAGRRDHHRHRQGAPSATWGRRSAPPPRCSPSTPTWPPTCRATRRAGDGRLLPTRSPAICAPTPRSRPTRAGSSTRWSRSTCRRWSPLINGPDTPDLAHRVGEVGAWARGNGVPTEISVGADRLVHQLLVRGHHPGGLHRPPGVVPTACGPGCQLLVTPGSEQVRATIERDGLLADLEAIGATVLANACGPCIGQWDRTDRRRPTSSTPSSTATTATSPSATTATPTPRRSSPRPTWSSPSPWPARSTSTRSTDTLTRLRSGRSARRRPSARTCPRGASTPASPDSSRRPDDRPASRSPSPRPPTGSSCWPRSRRGTATTTSTSPCCSRPRASARPTTSRRPAGGSRYRGHLENISGNLFLGVDQRVHRR